jgi:hypothetical protein
MRYPIAVLVALLAVSVPAQAEDSAPACLTCSSMPVVRFETAATLTPSEQQPQGPARHDTLRNGVLMGAAAGALVGFAAGAALCIDCAAEGFYAPGAFAALGAGIGAGLGAGIDALMNTHATKRGWPRRERVNVLPLFSKRVRGVMTSIEF